MVLQIQLRFSSKNVLLIVTSKKRVRKSFSVDDLRQEVVKEDSLQQLLDNFLAFPAESAPESNLRTLEAWLVARYDLLATVEILSFTRSAKSLPLNEQQTFASYILSRR